MVGYSFISPKHVVIFVMATCLGLVASSADDMSCTSQRPSRGNEMLQTNHSKGHQNKQLLSYNQSQEHADSSQVGDEADHDDEEGDEQVPAGRGPMARPRPLPATTATPAADASWCNDLKDCTSDLADLTNGDNDLAETQETFKGSYEVIKRCQRNKLRNSAWDNDAMQAVCQSWKTCMSEKGSLDDENTKGFLKAMGILGTGLHEDPLVKKAVPLSMSKCACLSMLNVAHCTQLDMPSKITCFRAMMCVDTTVSSSWKEFTCESSEVQDFIGNLDTGNMIAELEMSEPEQQHDSGNFRSLLESRAQDRWCPEERFGMKSMG